MFADAEIMIKEFLQVACSQLHETFKVRLHTLEQRIDYLEERIVIVENRVGIDPTPSLSSRVTLYSDQAQGWEPLPRGLQAKSPLRLGPSGLPVKSPPPSMQRPPWPSMQRSDAPPPAKPPPLQVRALAKPIQALAKPPPIVAKPTPPFVILADVASTPVTNPAKHPSQIPAKPPPPQAKPPPPQAKPPPGASPDCLAWL